MGKSSALNSTRCMSPPCRSMPRVHSSDRPKEAAEDEAARRPRNMGGDIGIALVTTLIARRSQFHQSRLVEHVVPSGDLNARLAAIAQHLQQLGVGAVDSTKMAYGQIYREVVRQAQTLAYIDVLVVFAIFTAIMVPLIPPLVTILSPLFSVSFPSRSE